MKHVFAILALIISGCSSKPIDLRLKALNYSTINSINIGTTDEKDIIALLGPPQNRSDESNVYTFNYDDPGTGFQRLSVNFFPSNKKVMSVLWLTRDYEPESSLNEAKKKFKNAKFKEIVENENNPHNITANFISYIDDDLGVTIRYDTGTKKVEGIARFDVLHRMPADTKKSKKSPYKI